MSCTICRRIGESELLLHDGGARVEGTVGIDLLDGVVKLPSVPSPALRSIINGAPCRRSPV